MLDIIYKAAEQAAPEEMCGLIIEKDGNEEFINCENFAENKLNEFKIDPKTFVKYQIKTIYMRTSILDRRLRLISFTRHNHDKWSSCAPGPFIYI